MSTIGFPVAGVVDCDVVDGGVVDGGVVGGVAFRIPECCRWYFAKLAPGLLR